MKSIDERLKKHPALKKRFESILDITENALGDCVRADDAEAKVIEEMRKLGQETIQDWASGQNEEQIDCTSQAERNFKRYKKKDSTGAASTGG